ncbi:MAG: substrate-binding domain-containing protein [Mediterranea sp.]|jgi:ribose transport system substrate-binding protein|nr:substrate-binding domain-containing protein [Mediterranea sp.]
MKEKYRIGLVMKSLQAQFFQVMQAGAVEYAATFPDVELTCVGTDTQTEVERQVELVRSLVTTPVDAIVLVPIDSKALVPPVIEAARAGIPVINIDIQLDGRLLATAGVSSAFVGPDNFTAAYLVGRKLAETLCPGDAVCILEGIVEADNARQRKEGFLQAINERGLHLVASASAHWETIEAATLYDDIATQHPELKAVFAANDAMALGTLQEMERRQRFLPIVGFDNDAAMKPYLQNGRLLATVDIFSARLAIRGIEYALAVLRGEKENHGVQATDFEVIG